jgi:uncharacterized membrane protein (DUF441 family)
MALRAVLFGCNLHHVVHVASVPEFEEINPAVAELQRLIDDAIKVGETEWETIWTKFDTDAREWLDDAVEYGKDKIFFRGIPVPPIFEPGILYLKVSNAVDLFVTLGTALAGITPRILVKVAVLRFPLPREWHQRAIPLDDGIRLGITLMTSALLDTIQSPTLPLEMMAKRWAGRIKFAKLLRSLPDFDPIEAAGILRSKVVEMVFRVVSALLTIGLTLGVLLALGLLALKLNSRSEAARIVPFALPQDSKRITITKPTRTRFNLHRGPDQ